MAKAPRPEVHPKTRHAWRGWLAKNHAKSDGVWLVFFKKGTGNKLAAPTGHAEQKLWSACNFRFELSGFGDACSRVTKIDPRTNRILRTIMLGYRPDGVTVYDGLVWVAVAPRR